MNGHALARFREHHPRADWADLLAALAAGENIDAALANALCGRAGSPDPEDRYVLAPDQRGIFVIVADQVRTYLRLGDEARRIVSGPIEPVASQVRTGKGMEQAAHARLFELFEPWRDTRVFFDAAGDGRFDLFLVIACLEPDERDATHCVWRFGGGQVEAFYDQRWGELTVSMLPDPDSAPTAVRVRYPGDTRGGHLLRLEGQSALVRIAPPAGGAPRGKLRLVPLSWIEPLSETM